MDSCLRGMFLFVEVKGNGELDGKSVFFSCSVDAGIVKPYQTF